MEVSFRDKLLLEQVRAMEQAGALRLAAGQPAAGSASLQQRLVARARDAVRQHDLQGVVGHAAAAARGFVLLLVLLAAGLGGAAVYRAVTGDGDTLNVYWLLLVLLGFNTLAMALWLAGMLLLRAAGPGSAPLAVLWRWLALRLLRGEARRVAADRGWLRVCHHGAAGRWWLSSLSHGLWLTYLCAGSVVLLLLLMTRQYDFVWATTILADGTFVMLTGALAAPLQLLGFSVPDLQQVQLSRRGMEALVAADLRRAWASFLLGSLLVYGLLPRLLLLALCQVLQALARRRYPLDLTLPYYLALQRQLMPASYDWKIVDPDTSEAPSPPAATAVFARAADIPAQALWVGVETVQTLWPPAAAGAARDLGQITGAESLAAVLARLDKLAPATLVVVVAADRLPDRGLKRTLQKLCAHTAVADSWLALLKAPPSAGRPAGEQRLDAWAGLARRCGIGAGRLTLIESDCDDRDRRHG